MSSLVIIIALPKKLHLFVIICYFIMSIKQKG